MIKIIVVVLLLLITYYFLRINNTEKYQINRLDNIDNIDNNIVLSNPFIWNQSTRFNRNSAPYLLLTPERFVLF